MSEVLDWQPMSTADHREHLLLLCRGVICSGEFRYGLHGEPQQDELVWRCDCSGRFGGFTHWALYPSLPVDQH